MSKRQLPPNRASSRFKLWLIGLAFSAGGALAALPAVPALAQTAASTQSASDGDGKDFWAGFWHRQTMLGDIFGLRPWLGTYGITFNLQEVSEILANATGGTRQGYAYEGLTTMTLQLDTDKAFDWDGGTFNVSALQIHGRNLSAERLLTLQTASGIEASRATRLWELWYQQAFLDGAYDVKLGQQSIDQEFISSQYSALYVNTMMGWPMLPSADLYAGGPAYPLSSPGVRLRAKPSDAFTVLAGVFDDNPPGGPFAADPQLRGAEASGTRFNLSTGALFLAELQYSLNQPSLGEMDTGTKGELGMPGTYKLGFWYDTASFPDQRFDNTGLSLADPASTGIPAIHRGNYSIYGVVDQMIWRPAPDSPRSLGAFARLMGAPSDRNLVAFSVNAGLNLKDPLPERENDTFGVGFGLAKVSSRAAGLDRDTGFFGGAPYPVRSSEKFIEATYQYQMTPWWQLQPDVQYMFNPGGGIQNPDTGARIRNELVFGVRTTITF